MYRTILVPLDGSPLAECALPLAEALAARSGARLILVRAAAVHGFPGTPVVDAQRRAVEEAQDYLRQVASRFDEGLRVEQAVCYGDAPEGIVSAVRLHRADLVVMATHARSPLGRLLHGSVGDQVLRRAAVPILLVPEACRRIWERHRPLRVVVPLDGSAFALQALDAVADLARICPAEVALVRVVEPPRENLLGDYPGVPTFDLEAALAAARLYLHDLAGSLTRTAARVNAYAVVGQPAAEIAALAEALPADMIAMATHGRSGVGRLLMGSVTAETLHCARTPLLLVRPQGVQVRSEEESPAEHRMTAAGALS